MNDALFSLHEQGIVVLYRPQDVVNIGGTVRAMKNMGFRHLRLVAPVPFVVADIQRIAHRSEDILALTHFYTDLDAALSDVRYVVGTTERSHGQHTIRSDIRILARDLLAQFAGGQVALLFGSEDNGLDTAALDRCHTLVRLPTDPAYPSLNLAQAVLLLLYELRMAAEETGEGKRASALREQPTTYAQLEELFAAWEVALERIEFFKTPHRQRVMRLFRAVLHRAAPDSHETALLMAIAREIVLFLQRKGRE